MTKLKIQNVTYIDVGGTNTRVLGSFPCKELVIGLRGVWTAQEKASWRKKLRGLAPTVIVLSDVELAHRLAFGKKPGILLNAGTGSIAFGRSPSGKTARAGGLGPLIGDEGSAFWIGRAFLKKQSGDAALRKKAVDPNSIRLIAAAAKKAFRSAAGRPIIDQAEKELAALVTEIKRKLKWKSPAPVKLGGGLFSNAGFRRRVAARIRRNGDRVV